MSSKRDPERHSNRHFCQSARIVAALALTVAVLGSAAAAQAPLQERILGRLITVPALSQRVEVRRIENGVGAFSGLRRTAATRIFGIVINEHGLVLPSAGVVLIRSIRDGRAVAHSDVDAQGRFDIRGVDSGLYTAELHNSAGSVLTASPAFTIGAGEVVQLTPVLAQTSFAGLTQFLSSGTASAINSAVAAGVMTVAPLPNVSPER